MTNNNFSNIDLALLASVTGGENDSGQPASTWIGCTASAAGNYMQGQSAGGAISDWGRCVQTGQPIPQGGTQPGQG
ncbi:MAG: hypothetical protein JO257_04865 [Deltaproteobacteria bacterium]|nr:hypothetical protein [Deltaproteobacteria bacterium]